MGQIDVLATSTELQSEFIRGLTADSSLDLLLERIVEKATQTLNANACSVFTIDASGTKATQRAGSGYQKRFNGLDDVPVVPANEVIDNPVEHDDRLGFTGWILSTGKPLLARSPEEVSSHPHHSRRQQILGDEIRLQTFLGVPIRGLHGEVVGVIKAERTLHDRTVSQPASQPFSEKDQLALQTIARVASRCITYVKMASQGAVTEGMTSWSRDVISEAAGTEGELDSFLNIIVEVTAAATRADSCGVFLKDESGKTLTQRAGIGSQTLRSGIRSYPWPDPQIVIDCKDSSVCHPPTCDRACDRPDESKAGLTAWIAATGYSFRAANYRELSKHCHHKGKYDQVNFEKGQLCGAFLGVPLRVGGSIIGVVKVENISGEVIDDNRRFSKHDQQRLEILAEDIAMAILRFQEQIPARYHIIHEAEKTILEILRGGLSRDELVEKVVVETRKLFNAGACALFLKEGPYLRQPPWAASGWAQLGPGVRQYALVEPADIKDNPLPHEKQGLTVWIAVKQQKFTARSNTELAMHPHHKGTFDKDNFPEGERCQSFMGFPLLIREDNRTELVGVLKVESKMRQVGGSQEYTYFNELDERVCELIANSAALAIQNARLVESRRKGDLELAENLARVGAWEEFSAMAAHRISGEAIKIRAAVRFLREDIERTETEEHVQQYLAWIKAALDRMDSFVREFSQYAAPPRLRPERINVNRLCEDALSDFVAPEGIRVRRLLAKNIPDMWADKGMLSYDLREMIQNAIKAMPTGGDLEIATSLQDGGKYVQIEFIDTGKGIPPELKHKIFEPGFKARPDGTGLGLAIVKKSIVEHKGEVFERGMFNQGAHFVLRLPVNGLEAEAVAETILVVEDNPEQNHFLQRAVREGAPNRRVFAAQNEHDARKLLKEHSFDAVITDINLDENDSGGSEQGGLEVVRLAAEQNIPSIVVSALSKIPRSPFPIEEEVRKLGCHTFIPKAHPTGDYLDVVKETLSQVLEQRRANARAAGAP